MRKPVKPVSASNIATVRMCIVHVQVVKRQRLFSYVNRMKGRVCDGRRKLKNMYNAIEKNAQDERQICENDRNMQQNIQMQNKKGRCPRITASCNQLTKLNT